eukprot:CAMPEP_0182418322 /NCGR_PEP_ID=MMETSP1167-20130531/2787_1 /TAXON_ID=2988 /ORGANISM="Mallomonas Sp, Strain CCMP3275" /LENGTH=337 /DNA_ID=CAMNT_0024592481 /DNA_START=202 /DNA_END=1215 /DNA_ORIENTATION=+
MALMDVMETETLCKMLFFERVSSTMDTAKEIIKNTSSTDVFAVITKEQTSGRGTRGRTWMSSYGNLMMTVVFKVSSVPVPITLMPLRIGTLIARVIEAELSTSTSTSTFTNPLQMSHVKLKWPNDILINSDKVCGILIEIENDSVLVGIGCNVVSAPSIQDTMLHNGRSATYVLQHKIIQERESERENESTERVHSNKIIIVENGQVTDNRQTDNIKKLLNENTNSKKDLSTDSQTCDTITYLNNDTSSTAQELYIKLAERIGDSIGEWIRGDDSAESVVSDFERGMIWEAMRLRDVSEDHTDGNTIKPLGVNPDGTLQVEYVRTGKRTALVADYLF